jgi:hypothetical protein
MLLELFFHSFMCNVSKKLRQENQYYFIIIAVVFFCIDLAEFRYFFAFFGRKCLIYSVSCYLNLNFL